MADGAPGSGRLFMKRLVWLLANKQFIQEWDGKKGKAIKQLPQRSARSVAGTMEMNDLKIA